MPLLCRQGESLYTVGHGVVMFALALLNEHNVLINKGIKGLHLKWINNLKECPKDYSKLAHHECKQVHLNLKNILIFTKGKGKLISFPQLCKPLPFKCTCFMLQKCNLSLRSLLYIQCIVAL